MGIARSPGFTYGVNNSLVEEGIYSVVATPLGPNLSFLEEKEEGVLSQLLKDAGVWKKIWFKEVRKWDKSDVECFRTTKVSICGIPCFVRNTKFIDSLLSDMGLMVNSEKIDPNPQRLDVTSMMIFTSLLRPIARKVSACVDGTNYTILISEEA